MEYNICFDVCGTLILAVILITFYLNYNVPVIQHQFFRALIWTAFLSTLMDLLSGVWGNYLTEATAVFPAAVPWLIHLVYFAARSATPVAFLLYVLSVMNIREKTIKGILVLLIPTAVIELLVLSDPFHKLIFYIDPAGAYHRGPKILLIYAVAFAYMAFAMALIIVYHKLIPMQQYTTFILFEMIALATVVMQGIYPRLLIEGFGTSLSLLMTYLTIQKPEEILDGSTGFLNKKIFADMCMANFKQKTRFTVILLILDDYDLLEKSYGINVMEKLMSQVASYLRRFPGLTPCRIGEQKFCLIGNSADYKMLERSMEAVDGRFLKPWKVSEYNVMLPACCCMLRCPEDEADFVELMELIDTVADLEKEDKKRMFRIGELDIPELRRRHKIELLVKEAVERDLLEVIYQPIYSSKKKRFSSAEALLRMQDKELGNIPPDEFIPIAEKNGAIVKIGKYVLDTVCRFIAENHLQKYGIEYIEVNLSAVECLQEDMAENVMKYINSHGLRPEQINLEITETAISFLPESVDEKMSRLLTEGVTFSLDDYGTGYSNLSRLAALPLEIIKIDKSIVQEAFTSETMKVILDNTLRMVSMLDKKVLAEGVEEKEQADYLIEKGCDYIQGFYYARPVTGAEFIRILEGQL